MKYLGKTTNELTENDFSMLTGLFNHVYVRNIDISLLKHKYHSPVFGFSYHGLMYNDADEIVGALTFIPFEYQYFERQIVSGCAADLMIHENSRKDLLSFKFMYESALERIGNSLDFLYAVPNSNAYLYWTKILKWKDLGKIRYYIQVLNVSKLVSVPAVFDWFSKFITYCQNSMVYNRESGGEEQVFSIYIQNNIDFKKYRFAGKYIEIIESNKYAFYSLVDEGGIKTAYIIDLFPVSNKWTAKVVKRIHALEKHKIDIIMYIGTRIKTPLNLIKVPHRFEPRVLHLIGKKLSDRIDDRIFDLNYWNYNLANFDVR